MRDEADTWVEGKARSQRWGVLGLRQVGIKKVDDVLHVSIFKLDFFPQLLQVLLELLVVSGDLCDLGRAYGGRLWQGRSRFQFLLRPCVTLQVSASDAYLRHVPGLFSTKSSRRLQHAGACVTCGR